MPAKLPSRMAAARHGSGSANSTDEATGVVVLGGRCAALGACGATGAPEITGPKLETVPERPAHILAVPGQGDRFVG